MLTVTKTTNFSHQDRPIAHTSKGTTFIDRTCLLDDVDTWALIAALTEIASDDKQLLALVKQNLEDAECNAECDDQ